MEIKRICVDYNQWVRNSVCSNPRFVFNTNSPDIDIICVEDHCIDVQITGTSDLFLTVEITCDDHCVGERKFTQEINLCTANSHCPSCSSCIEGVCVTNCNTNEQCNTLTNTCEPCPVGICTCQFDTDCACNQRCFQGKCDCPINTYKNHRGCCVSCLLDEHCPPCYVCRGGECVPKCGAYMCNPVTEHCVECVNSGDCLGDHMCCINGMCLQCPIDDCECNSDQQCNSCEICDGCKCIPINCPNNKACYNDQCYEYCVEGQCPVGTYAIIHNDQCICIECSNLPCIHNADCGFPNCVCINGFCSPNPCYSEGNICPENCGQWQGECVPCDTFNCTDCVEVVGCQCLDTHECIYTGCSGNCSEGCPPGCGCYQEECFDCSNLNCEECANAVNCLCTESNCHYSPEYDCDNFSVNITLDINDTHYIITAIPNLASPSTIYIWNLDLPNSQYFVETAANKSNSNLHIIKSTGKPINIEITVYQTSIGNCVKTYSLVIPPDCADFENIIKNSITLCS